MSAVNLSREYPRTFITLSIIGAASLGYRIQQQAKYEAMGREAKQEVLTMVRGSASVRLREPNPVPTAEFLELLPHTIERSKVVFDPEQTENKHACACAFSILIKSDGKVTDLNQHHLYLDGQYYHLEWSGDDLFQMIELWHPFDYGLTDSSDTARENW